MKRLLSGLVVVATLGTACTALTGLDANYELSDTVPFSGDGGVDVILDGASPESGSADGATQDVLDSSTACTTPPCSLRCGAEACRSCREVHQSFPALESGIHLIETQTGALAVYCDLAIEGGGWTLVGKSASGGTASAFGWHSSQGSPTDDTKPYSLDVGSLSFTPTEMLFGSVTSAKNWGANVYRSPLPVNFVSAYKTTATAISLITVKGPCQGGAMHSHSGYTARTDVYFFRDNDSDDYVFGLFPFGWFANDNPSCSYASGLDSLQGMIFVR